MSKNTNINILGTINPIANGTEFIMGILHHGPWHVSVDEEDATWGQIHGPEKAQANQRRHFVDQAYWL